MGLALDRFLERFQHRIPERKGFRVLCPAHADHDPSLHVEESADGSKILVTCRAGCDTKAAVEAAGATMAELYESHWTKQNGSHEGRANTGARGQGRPPFDHRHITHVYEYIDEQNHPLFEVVRDRNKNFLQRRVKPGHRDPGEEIVYEYNLDGVRRVLYKLPEVLAARRFGQRIYFVEGEKDADNLRALGLCATTAAQGASAAWIPQYTEELAGAADVVIIPDNDEPGRRHAQKIRDAIADWVSTVRVLDLPDLPEKGDVSDWIEKGGTKDQLEQLANTARPHVTPAQRFTSIDLSLGEFMARSYPKPRSYLADGLIGAGDLVFFYGKPGIGKTWAILQLAQAWTKGEGLLGLSGPEGGPIRVGILELELNAWFLQQKRIPGVMTDLSGDWNERFKLVVRPDLRGAVDIMADDWPSWARWVQDRDLDVLVVDALSRAHQVDENKAVEFGPVLRRLDELRFETGVTIVAVHHEPKMSADGKERDDMDALRGTSRMQSDSNALIRLVELKKDELFALKFPKTNNAAPISPIYLTRPKNSGFVLTDYSPELRKAENVDKVREALFKAGDRGMTDLELAGATGLSKKTCARHREVCSAIKTGERVPVGDGKARKHLDRWRLPDTARQDGACPAVNRDGMPVDMGI